MLIILHFGEVENSIVENTKKPIFKMKKKKNGESQSETERDSISHQITFSINLRRHTLS